MKSKTTLHRMFILLITLMSAIGANAQEAYACFTPSNATLTFYYDNLRSTRTGTTYDLNTGKNATGWDTDGTKSSVTKVVFDPSFAGARPSTTRGWFFRMYELESITGMNYLNTSEVTNMNYMFMGCTKLTNLDVSHFDTSNVTDMIQMFNGCYSLTSLDLSSFNTSKVTDMLWMFHGCINLQTIYVGSGWTTNVLIISSEMFYDCTKLVGGQGTTYDANYVDGSYAHIDGGTSNPGYLTEKPKEAYACYTSSNNTLTFYYDNLRNTRLGTTYNLNRVGDTPSWVNDGKNAYVTKVVFDPLFADARPTSTYGWFYQMENLQTIEGLSYLNTSEVTDMTYMFGYCKKLTSLDLSNFNTSKVTDMKNMFYSCLKLQTIYVGEGWSTAAVTSSSNMFMGCRVLVGGKGTAYDVNHVNKTYARIDGSPSNPGYFTALFETYACYTPSDYTLTFYYDRNRRSRGGTTYDLNSGNTPPQWFSDGTYDNVTKVVFDPTFARARPTTTYAWFYGMTNLSNITGMSYLNTSEVTNMKWMFYYCSSLKSLDLNDFNTAKVTDMTDMFRECSNLRTIYVGDGWNTEAVTISDGMFSNCTSLVGGKGTIYNDSNPKDKTCAHIDGGTSNPGYFTAEGTEAYACYTPGNMTLTFYYDNLRSSREGTTYDLNTGNNRPGWHVDGPNQNVIYVVFDPSFAGARPTSTYEWFDSMYLLEFITGMNYLNTSEVTDMSSMFYSCSKLTSLDVSNFNTSKVTKMLWVFAGCRSLTSLDLSSFNTSKVTDMHCMFYRCSDLLTIYVGNGWSTAAVTSSTDMFLSCKKLMGGKGTVYNENHVEADYAHIDGGTSNPGYFSDVSARQAYAVYTEDNTTMTFYYDSQRDSREGTTYDLNTGSNLPGWFTDGYYSSVTKVVFDLSFANARPTSTFYWFMGMRSLQSIVDLSCLNTSEVTNMSYMFTGCQLASLNLINFNTSKVTDMAGMFESAKLTTLNLSSFNTSEVTSMSTMFRDCNKLVTIYVSDEWNPTKVTNSGSMFQNCTSLVGGQGTEYKPTYPSDKAYAHIDGGPSDPGYFTFIAEGTEAYACYTPGNTTLTFYYDNLRDSRSGTTYDLNTGHNSPGWSIDGKDDYITKVVFDPSFAGARPTSTFYWFGFMLELQTIEGMSYLNTSEVTDMAKMFWACSKLTSLDLSGFNTAKVANMYSLFCGCYYLKTIYIGSEWSTEAVTDSDDMFKSCFSLVGGNGTTFDADHTNEDYAHIDGEGGAGYFTAAGAQPWTSLAYACYDDGTLTFYYDNYRSSREGTTYDLNAGSNEPDWYTDNTYKNVTKVVFDPSFADARPTSTFYWFCFMSDLQTIEGMSYLNTSNVAYMDMMFYDCSQLTSLDLSSFNTSKVADMFSMFYGCSNLTSLNLSSFNTSKVADMFSMFYGCTNLRTIYVGDGWSTASAVREDASYDMFSGCTSLVGGQGTTYNANHVDKTYAHIDGGPSNPGYFTARTTGIATDLHQVTSDKQQVQSDEWYTIDGRKLNGMPTKKGVYIQNGKKTVVK